MNTENTNSHLAAPQTEAVQVQGPSSVRDTMVALANLPRVLSSATLLHRLGLIDKEPSEIVKAYVECNPCINAHLAKLGSWK